MRLLKVIAAAIVAGLLACVLVEHGASDRVAFCAYLFCAIGMAALLGAFDIDTPERKNRHLTIGQGIGYIKYRKAV